MAAIAQTNGVTTSDRAVTLTRTALGASDTLAYTFGGNQMVMLYNTTASPVIVTFTGTNPVSLAPPGFGGDVSTSGGKAITVPASGLVMVNLDDIYAFIAGANAGSGTVTVSGGTGVVAALFTLN